MCPRPLLAAPLTWITRKNLKDLTEAKECKDSKEQSSVVENEGSADPFRRRIGEDFLRVEDIVLAPAWNGCESLNLEENEYRHYVYIFQVS